MTHLSFGESETVEFKTCVGKKHAQLPSDFWNYVCSFANTRGGSIFVGVNDCGEVMNLSYEELDDLQKDISAGSRSGKLSNPLDINVAIMNGYLEVVVPELPLYDKPVFVKKDGMDKIWVRRGSTTVTASMYERKSLLAGASGGGENQIVNVPIASANEGKVNAYLALTGLQYVDFNSLNDKLVKLKAANNGYLTVFGLVAFCDGELIDSIANNLYVDFRLFDGSAKVSDDLSKVYLERQEFHGDLKEQFLSAYDYIRTKLPTENVVDPATGLREERYILPVEALREALANAIAHRDYLIQDSCINVDLYSDRIEISNPGESLVPIDDLEKASSKARNPNVMEFLKANNVTDKSARGIPTIYQAARNRGLLDPIFENIAGCFKATLFFSSPHSIGDKDWINHISQRFILRDTQMNAMVYVKNNGSISNREYCNINHMNNRSDDRKARRELSDLVDKGLLRVEGAGPGTKYLLVDKVDSF